ncbi:MAG: amidohydrolase family protein [Gemmatimonadetes bacterium]|nr:amidohydrolase family protein [Gemmatimonadota bacterium]MCY3677244.1 amidohydrolase family protein [Gemmatimonadota bacterium]MYA44074.1 amidohydrolase family protein [Gemmatimonadota bacterium]MYE92850.1 amidohydrolase family protein [Gemmatimonadota bacterium]MYJ12560.1 amidohydrolase family protein [Gemmatimonadota bacterium]
MRATLFTMGFAAVLATGAEGQQASRTQPVQGMRDNGTGYHALVGARVVTGPGQVLDDATIVIRDGLVQAVGRGMDAPAGARVWDLEGLTVYPGFIDAHADLEMDAVPEGGDVGPTHWNPQVRAWFSTTRNLADDEDRRAALRSQGFGTALAVPKEGIFRGTASVVNLGDEGVRERVLRPDIAQAIGFQRSFDLGGSYPNSAMGTIALMKQTLMDAEWYMRAWDAYESSGRAFLPPETSEALAALGDVVQGSQPVVFETGGEEEYLRAHSLSSEFGLTPWFRGNGLEYRLIDVLRGRNDPLVVPLDFPDAPDVGHPAAALDASLGDLRHWYLAPTNPAQLADAGVSFAITSDGLSSLNEFLPNLRLAVARGLSADDALAALTTTPASWLGIDRTHGTIAEGKVANLVVSEGDLFTEEATVRDVWVQGRVYGVTRPTQIDPRGTWQIASDDEWGFEADLVLEGPLNRLRGYLDIASTGPELPGGARVDIESASAVAETGRIQARFNGEVLGYQGTALLSGSVRGDEFYGWTSLPNGADPSFRGTRTEDFEGPSRGTVALDVPEIDLPFIRPMMDYGRTSTPEQPAAVLVRNATVWTQGPQGMLEGADLLVRAGTVEAVGMDLDAPRGAVEIDATGKHVTPGMIDPHIHSGVSAVNESGFAIVPEVRMGDVVTHNNIWMYRQVAGGLTTAHIKHGSANPIGGENVFVKMRWGSLPDDLKLENAPRTVKFALGENPKRRQGRYPDTRMGTQEIIRDHFMAARDYEREWQRWEETGEGLPPRRDLRMEAILDILDQELLISSHGYRADEFLALVRLAEEFGFRVQTLQHGVEAYKIAPELAASGVAAVVWSDWGAFKLEAYDATVYNARILIEAGVVTSLHSDNSEIASRMNWEAGKLLRTGLTPEQALSTVTNQAAEAIAIHDQVGSLEPGKDADFVIWSGDPLSQFTRAEQTWIDGRRYFSLEEDAAMRDRIAQERTQLIQAILSAGGGGGRSAQTETNR